MLKNKIDLAKMSVKEFKACLAEALARANLSKALAKKAN